MLVTSYGVSGCRFPSLDAHLVFSDALNDGRIPYAKPEKLVAGHYRLRVDGSENFGQIVRRGIRWEAQVRRSGTGELSHYAGEWSTLREAAIELTSELTPPAAKREACKKLENTNF